MVSLTIEHVLISFCVINHRAHYLWLVASHRRPLEMPTIIQEPIIFFFNRVGGRLILFQEKSCEYVRLWVIFSWLCSKKLLFLVFPLENEKLNCVVNGFCSLLFAISDLFSRVPQSYVRRQIKQGYVSIEYYMNKHKHKYVQNIFLFCRLW